MSVHTDAPARMRRVAAELGDLRRQNGLRAEEVAAVMGFSLSKLSRMENGRRGLRVDDVSALLGLYRVPAQRRDELLAMVRTGHERNWWQVSGDLPPNWRDLLQFEAEATAIYNWELTIIPGLLQTDEYAESIIRNAAPSLSADQRHELVVRRMDRQARYWARPTAEFTAVIDETALRRPVGGAEVMRKQLKHLARATRTTNAVVQVVPLAADEHPGLIGSFMLMELLKERSLVYLEHRDHCVFLEEPPYVKSARDTVRRLRACALKTEDSVDLINKIADQMA